MNSTAKIDDKPDQDAKPKRESKPKKAGQTPYLTVVIWLIVILCVVLLGKGVSNMEKRKTVKDAIKREEALATGKKAAVGLIDWDVTTYIAENGKCYKVHTKWRWAFAIPCE